MLTFVRLLATIVVTLATFSLAAPSSIPASTLHSMVARSGALCEIAREAKEELHGIQEELNIYQYADSAAEARDIRERSSSRTWACAEAMAQVEQYAPNYRDSLRKLSAATEASVALYHRHCTQDTETDDTVLSLMAAESALTQYAEARAQHEAAEAEKNRLGEVVDETCADSAQDEFDAGVHDEL